MSRPTIVEDVCLELTEMRRVGMAVPAGAEDYARNHSGEIEEYRDSMSISEMADLVIELAV